MFVELIKGVREIRKPLAAGYLGLYIVLIGFPQEASDVLADGAFDRIHTLLGQAGSASVTAIIAVTATIVGGVLIRLVDEPLSSLVSKVTWQDDLDRHLVRARRQLTVFRGEAYPSYQKVVEERVAAIERRVEEHDFRLTLFWLLTCAAICTGLATASGWFWLGLLVPPMVAVDCHLITRQIRDLIVETQIDADRATFIEWGVAPESSEELSLLSQESPPRHSWGRRIVMDHEGMALMPWEFYGGAGSEPPDHITWRDWLTNRSARREKPDVEPYSI